MPEQTVNAAPVIAPDPTIAKSLDQKADTLWGEYQKSGDPDLARKILQFRRQASQARGEAPTNVPQLGAAQPQQQSSDPFADYEQVVRNPDGTLLGQRPGSSQWEKIEATPQQAAPQQENKWWQSRPASDYFGGMGMDTEAIKNADSQVGGKTGEVGKQIFKGLLSYGKDVAFDPFKAVTDPIDFNTHNIEKAIQDKNMAELAGALTSLYASKEPNDRAGAAARKVIRPALGIGDTAVDIARKAHEAALDKAQQDYRSDLDKVNETNASNRAASKESYLDASQKVADKNAAAKADYDAKVAKAHADYAQSIRDHTEASKSASAQQTAAQAKQGVSGAVKRGPLYRHIAGMADQVAANAAQTEKGIRAGYGQMWNKLREDIGEDSTVNWVPVKQAVIDAENNVLSGSPESIKLFKNILGEGSKDFMDTEGGAAKAAISKTDLPYRDAQGYYTELGDKMYGAMELPGDVYHALKTVREAVGQQMDKLADSKGLGSVSRQLRSNWAEFMERFHDKGSPIRKLMEAGKSDARLGVLSSDTDNAIADTLGRFSKYGGDPNLAGRVRSIRRTVSELPGSEGTMPDKPDTPKLPPIPVEFPQPNYADVNIKGQPAPVRNYPFDPVEWRKQKMAESAKSLSGLTKMETGALGAPMLPFRRSTGWLLNQPLFQEWLSKR